jgi:DNA-3-methyladenine glycosylase II
MKKEHPVWEDHLREQYPEIAKIFSPEAPLPRLYMRCTSIPLSVTQVVAGQMLSKKAADTILDRVEVRAKAENRQPWELEPEVLRELGLSKSKAATITSFGEYYRNNTAEIEAWPSLKYGELKKSICTHKGLGEWTASVLALYHFGFEDVFPDKDGIIRRAMGLVKEKYGLAIDPAKAKPYRSYLALALWRAVGSGALADDAP